MATLCNRAGHYIFALWFLSVFYLSFFFFLGPSANLECRSERCCARLAANAGPKKVAKNRHLGTIPQLCRAISLQPRHVSTIGKKLVKQQYLLYMSAQYGELGPLAAEIVLLVWGTPGNFNSFRVLAAILHGTLVLVVSQLWHWTEGATYIRQGGHHVGHWRTFLVFVSFSFKFCAAAALQSVSSAGRPLEESRRIIAADRCHIPAEGNVLDCNECNVNIRLCSTSSYHIIHSK